jgi:hypothetical protein
MSEYTDHNSGSPIRSPRKRIAGAARSKAIAWLAGEKNTSKGKRTGKRARQKSAERIETQKNILAVFSRALTTAYEKAGLDEENPEHESLLLLWLSWAVYGANSTGQPVKWSPELHHLLVSDIARLRECRPELTELELCHALVSGRDRLDRYKKFKNGSSLRRRLQTAKKKTSQ